jgi:flagellar biosynthesis protein FlhF
MKIRTYIAKDMRQALRQVREEQGPDAVILSTRSVPGGVEVSAAIDFELAQAAALPPKAPATHAAPFVALVDDDGDFTTLLSRTALAAARPTVALPAAAPVDALAVSAAREDAMSLESTPRAELGAELRSMRHMLETQLAQLAWNEIPDNRKVRLVTAVGR